jgi:hypothetical protein
MTYKQYRRTAVAEMMDWHPSVDMTGVSISDADRKAGSPKHGDKIARNPANHEDRWLVAADYFAANFEQSARSAAPGEPVAWASMMNGRIVQVTKERAIADAWQHASGEVLALYAHPLTPTPVVDHKVGKVSDEWVAEAMQHAVNARIAALVGDWDDVRRFEAALREHLCSPSPK